MDSRSKKISAFYIGRGVFEDPDPEEEVLIFLIQSLCLGDCMRMMRMMRRMFNSSLLDHCWSTFGTLLVHI
eukprot:5704099-Heterocapsa_arctica.AAC.1